jgi:hypothetical protein
MPQWKLEEHGVKWHRSRQGAAVKRMTCNASVARPKVHVRKNQYRDKAG